MGKIIIGVFQDFMMALSTAPDLVRAGIRREEISAVAQPRPEQQIPESCTPVAGYLRSESEPKAVFGRVDAQLSGTATFVSSTGPLVVTGPLAAAIAAPSGGVGTGSFVGALTRLGILEREARAYDGALGEGHALVIVSTTDAMAVQVMEIFAHHHAAHISMRCPQPAKRTREQLASALSY
jgi:hypothetical protein